MRKSLCKILIGLPIIVPLQAWSQDFDDVVMTVHPVAGNVSYIEGRGGNIGLFTGEDGVFLIDDQNAPLTDLSLIHI